MHFLKLYHKIIPNLECSVRKKGSSIFLAIQHFQFKHFSVWLSQNMQKFKMAIKHQQETKWDLIWTIWLFSQLFWYILAVGHMPHGSNCQFLIFEPFKLHIDDHPLCQNIGCAHDSWHNSYVADCWWQLEARAANN